jgi:hypothetical protein
LASLLSGRQQHPCARRSAPPNAIALAVLRSPVTSTDASNCTGTHRTAPLKPHQACLIRVQKQPRSHPVTGPTHCPPSLRPGTVRPSSGNRGTPAHVPPAACEVPVAHRHDRQRAGSPGQPCWSVEGGERGSEDRSLTVAALIRAAASAPSPAAAARPGATEAAARRRGCCNENQTGDASPHCKIALSLTGHNTSLAREAALVVDYSISDLKYTSHRHSGV